MGDRTGLTKLDRTNGYEDGRGYMREKKKKLAQQNEQIREALRHRHSAMRTELFKGVSINVNGRTTPTADELKRLILLNGGEYHPYYRYQQTKFMIATNLSTARIKTLRPDDRIVKPNWIIDSLEANCVLPYQDYQLFAEEPRGKNVVLALDSDSSNQGQLSISSSSRPKALSSSSSSAADTSNRTIKNESKKQTSMNDFVVRGIARPSQQFHTPKVREQHKDIANICGQSDVNSIIVLLNEWVGCPEGILDEDVACVTKYFFDLMGEKHYHNKFCEILNALRHRVINHGENCWIEQYNNLAKTLRSELNSSAEASQNLSQLISLIEVCPKNESDVPETSASRYSTHSSDQTDFEPSLKSIPEVIDLD